MTSVAVEAIKAKAFALKPDGIEGVLNHLDPELKVLNNLKKRLDRRRGYLGDLKKALATAPKTVDKEPLKVIVKPLSGTVEKLHDWLKHAEASLSGLNKEVKTQNSVLASAIREFSLRNQNLYSNSRSTGQNLARVQFAAAA